MRRHGKDFSGSVTPLFPTMVVQAQEEMGEGSAMPTNPHYTPIITQPSSSQPQRKQKSRRSKRKDNEVGRSARIVSSDEASLGDHTDASKQGRKFFDIDADEDITPENVHDAEMFDVNDLHGDEVSFEKEVPVKEVSVVGKVNTASIATIVSTATVTKDEITLAQALAELKKGKTKDTTANQTATTKGILLQEPSESITTTTTIPSKDKGKGIMVKEPLQMKKKYQISFDEQEAIRLQAEFDKEAKIETDYELAQRLQAEEQEELTVDEKATLFQQLLEKRRKHFAAKRAEEKRNRPPTIAQQRSIMCTYLKNMVGWKPKDLKSKSFANIQELFDKAFKRVNTFVDFRTKLVEGSEQKVDDDQEAAKMKELMKIIPDEEEVAVDAIPLATKPPSIKMQCRGIYEKTKCWFESYLIPVDYTFFLSSSKVTQESRRFRSIPPELMKAFDEETDDLKINIKLRGDCGITRLLYLRVTAAQEKGFTIATLKNELRKLTGNSVNTKFAKPSILGKPVLQPLRNQSVVRQPTAFRSERPKFSKPRFASQVDVNNVLSKPVTPHYLPKVRESVFVKPNHVIASGSSRNSSKESYGSNDMAHNYYLEEAKKKTQDKNMNLKPSVMHTTSLQNTTNGSKPKPRSNNQTSRSLPVSKSSCGMSNGVPLVDHSRNSSSFSDSKHFVCSTCQKCVFNANHDACLTKFLKEVNSRIKVQSPKTRNNIKPVEKITNVIKPKRWISKGYRFSPNKSSAVHEKPNTPRSCLRWKPTGRIFKTADL
ncbi:hypothetical protein Tco_1431163 [Tanacetum coccineum]